MKLAKPSRDGCPRPRLRLVGADALHGTISSSLSSAAWCDSPSKRMPAGEV
jgi:hypothetical protein